HWTTSTAPMKSSIAKGSAVASSPFNGTADELHGLGGQRQPLVLGTRLDAEPFLHQLPFARVKVLPLASGRQGIHSLGRQLHYQSALHEHGEDLVVDLQRCRPEP